MSTPLRFTSADLDCLPATEGKRYEIIDGELHVSKQPQWHHQYVCTRIVVALQNWSDETGAGFTSGAPGLVLAGDDDVVPDVAWVSAERLPGVLDERGHFRSVPDLVVEVLSPGAANERRDRDLKLKLYSRQGAREYWIVDWRAREVQVFRREGEALSLRATLRDGETLTSPLLPGFAGPVSSLWPPAF